MDQTELQQSIGSWEDRQAFTSEVAAALKSLLADLVPSVEVIYRAKTDESILEKISRFGESVEEVHDLYGLRLVVEDFDQVEKVTTVISEHFGETPTEKEMLIRGGTLAFAPIRNYRKRDWIGVSPASSGGYTDAIHLNRIWNGRMIELQVVTRELFKKYYEPDADESHTLFKQRQAVLYRKNEC